MELISVLLLNTILDAPSFFSIYFAAIVVRCCSPFIVIVSRLRIGGAAIIFGIDCHSLGIAALAVVVVVHFGRVVIGTASSSSSAALILLFHRFAWRLRGLEVWRKKKI